MMKNRKFKSAFIISTFLLFVFIISNITINANPITYKMKKEQGIKERVKCRYVKDSVKGKEMLIITHDNFVNDIKPFSEWKSKIGIKNNIVKMSEISKDNNSEEIKKYIKTYYNNNPDLYWILLVGDYQHISSPNSSTGELRQYKDVYSRPSDAIYAKVEGNDDETDLYIGRFSAETHEDVKTQVDRTINFEKNKHYKKDWFKKALCLAGDDDTTMYNPIEHMKEVKDILSSSSFRNIKELNELSNVTHSQISQNINSGVGLINYVGHGDPEKWWLGEYNMGKINELTNLNKLPVIISVSCFTGAFDIKDEGLKMAFAESWLRARDEKSKPIGAVAAYMSTATQPFIQPCIAQNKINELFKNKTKGTLGEICYKGTEKMFEECGGDEAIITQNTWVLFGDPSLRIFDYVKKAKIKPTTEEVIFTNKNFEKLVRKRTNNPNGKIYQSDLDKIRFLYAGIYEDEFKDEMNDDESDGEQTNHIKHDSLFDLEGIQYLRNLEGLYLSNSSIINIDKLKFLKKLNYVSLRYNKIKDISVLNELKELKRIDLSGNKELVDLSALSALPKIKVIKMKNCDIREVNSLIEIIRTGKLNELYIANDKNINIESIKQYIDLLEKTDLK